jgi:hypothetical protein
MSAKYARLIRKPSKAAWFIISQKCPDLQCGEPRAEESSWLHTTHGSSKNTERIVV